MGLHKKIYQQVVLNKIKRKTVNEILASIGYKNSYIEILDSSHYGVPQHRERVFIVCFRDDLNNKDFTFPKPSFSEICLNDILESDLLTDQFIIRRKDIVFKNDNKPVKKDLFGKSKLISSIHFIKNKIYSRALEWKIINSEKFLKKFF